MSRIFRCLRAATLVGAFFLLLPFTLRGDTNIVSGQITSDVTWSGTNLVLGTVTIRSNVTVSITPGAQMLMNTGATMIVNGRLLADGATNQPIVFTRATTAARWSRFMFVGAADSRFRNCIFEYANCAGDHQNYYPTNCTTGLGLNPRPYNEAIVAVGTHLDIEGCTFRNLVGGAGGNEGDAIAIISDDPVNPGTASANIRSCRFTGIGQGVHTRYSYVLVENCFFGNKFGDNDSIDLYGESSPVPLIRKNIILPGHEDAINPTRCSAIIVDNLIMGGDDHGVVLRDKCSPVVFNNVILNFANACIAVQNQCDAFIANNTIRNSARGIRFFDHTTRRGPPYCLFPGSGRATIVNNIIWDCTTSFELTDSPDTTFDSYANVIYCDVEGGQATATVTPQSVLQWGTGNINADPLFVNMAATNFHLLAGSPCIDAGTNSFAAWTNGVVIITNDLDGVARPLDGNGDGTNKFDIGAYEFLLATADSNSDGIPDGWAWQYGFNPLDSTVAAGNADGDGHSNYQEWVADTNPTNSASVFRIDSIRAEPTPNISFQSSSNRLYTLWFATNLAGSILWSNQPSYVDQRGSGAQSTFRDTNAVAPTFYRIEVKAP